MQQTICAICLTLILVDVKSRQSTAKLFSSISFDSSCVVYLHKILKELMRIGLYFACCIIRICCIILFKTLQPNFGASLHILKVEIGGDAQSSGLFLLFLTISF